ncbi:MAG: OmpH family outer membrane protein [Planctomycetia bacterium]|nr:OmpH family outer membrane protein [Planctomycetia bacterium]
MLSRCSIAALCGLLLACVGCGKTAQGEPTAARPEKPVGGVGVVDLDLLAKRLGRDLEMKNAVEERLASLNSKLTTLQGSLRRLYEEKKEKFGEDPTDEQLKELRATEDRMERELLDVRRKSEVELSNFRQALIDQFREQAKPVLREVAAALGLSIVVPKNDGLLLTIDPAVEITDEVAAKMPATGDAATEQEPPRKSKKRAAAETSSR